MSREKRSEVFLYEPNATAMPIVSCREPTIEFQDTKPWMDKMWRHEGPLSYIYPFL
jgi:hypothetical protein